MRFFFFVAFCLLSIISIAQPNANAKPDTSYYDKAAFDKELRELFGDFASDDLKKRTDEPNIKTDPKNTLKQVKELMLAAKKNYENFYNKNSLRTDNKDSVYTTTYKFNGAISNEIRKEKGTHISFLAILGTYSNAADGELQYNEWLQKLKQSLSDDFTIKEDADKFAVEFKPKQVRAKGRGMYLVIKSLYDKYALILTIRSDLSYPEVAKDGLDFDYNYDSSDPWKNGTFDTPR